MASKTSAAPVEQGEGSENRFPRWTFLSNHAHVLFVIYSDPEAVLRLVSAEVGITERAVQRIVADLEREGIIRRERVGRRNRYEVLTDAPLRHPIEAHRTVGDLLRLIAKDDPE
nr:winged helix-turn-helix domain-containing protein [Stratiformator vulcanicus]